MLLVPKPSELANQKLCNNPCGPFGSIWFESLEQHNWPTYQHMQWASIKCLHLGGLQTDLRAAREPETGLFARITKMEAYSTLVPEGNQSTQNAISLTLTPRNAMELLR